MGRRGGGGQGWIGPRLLITGIIGQVGKGRRSGGVGSGAAARGVTRKAIETTLCFYGRGRGRA